MNTVIVSYQNNSGHDSRVKPLAGSAGFLLVEQLDLDFEYVQVVLPSRVEFMGSSVDCVRWGSV